MAMYLRRNMSSFKVIKKRPGTLKEASPSPKRSSGLTRNAFGIQLLSPSLHEQVFPNNSSREVNADKSNVNLCLKELRRFDLCTGEPETIPAVDFQLPELYGRDVDEHFRRIAEQQVAPYRELAERLVSSAVPARPASWVFRVSSRQLLPWTMDTKMKDFLASRLNRGVSLASMDILRLPS
jgi:hypothetical protein